MYLFPCYCMCHKYSEGSHMCYLCMLNDCKKQANNTYAYVMGNDDV